MAPKKKHYVADFHSPHELLDTAQELLNAGNAKFLRASILESITSLEAFMYQKIFPLLYLKYPKSQVDKLKKDTERNFDDRLSKLVPMAINAKVNKSDSMWKRLKTSRQLRHKVVHEGKVVARQDAQDAYDIMYEWLEYLTSSIAIELELYLFKKHVEEKKIRVTHTNASDVIADYFGTNDVREMEPLKTLAVRYEPDVVLRFGKKLVIFEHKFTKSNDYQEIISRATQQVMRMMSEMSTTKPLSTGAVIIFTYTEIPVSLQNVKNLGTGIYVAFVKIDSLNNENQASS